MPAPYLRIRPPCRPVGSSMKLDSRDISRGMHRSRRCMAISLSIRAGQRQGMSLRLSISLRKGFWKRGGLSWKRKYISSGMMREEINKGKAIDQKKQVEEPVRKSLPRLPEGNSPDYRHLGHVSHAYL